MFHYTEEILEKYRNGNLSWLSRIICKLHLLKCENCQQKLAELEKDDFLLHDIRNQLKNEQTTGNDATYQKLCEYFHTTTGSSI